MSFQVGIGSLGGAVFFSGGILYPSANYALSTLSMSFFRLKEDTSFQSITIWWINLDLFINNNVSFINSSPHFCHGYWKVISIFLINYKKSKILFP